MCISLLLLFSAQQLWTVLIFIPIVENKALCSVTCSRPQNWEMAKLESSAGLTQDEKLRLWLSVSVLLAAHLLLSIIGKAACCTATRAVTAGIAHGRWLAAPWALGCEPLEVRLPKARGDGEFSLMERFPRRGTVW